MYELRRHIQETWRVLERSPLDPAHDPKLAPTTSYLYVPKSEVIDFIAAQVALRRKQTGNPAMVVVEELPEDTSAIQKHGVLYLPKNYVVPGDRFNEMYGWDSYWIVKGLIRDRHYKLAEGMVENCFYQIEHYGGKIANGNRTYLYERSHPPVTALMVDEVSETLEARERIDFLTRAEAALTKNYYEFWKTRHYTETTKLFHYGHPGDGRLGLCPEVIYGERDHNGHSHYDKIIADLGRMAANDPRRLAFYDAENNTLTRHAIAGDRAMRASGFDPSMHLGYYGLDTHLHNPVCLNSLLLIHCRITAAISEELGHFAAAEAMRGEARSLSAAIQAKLWSNKLGLFTALNYQTGQLSDFPFLTSAYPLVSGIATQEQARSFRDVIKKDFETEFGLLATPANDDTQWKKMWAPLVDLTCIGLRQYDFHEDARRIEEKFLLTVNRVFESDKAVFEKYDPVTGTSHVKVGVGYEENVRGFGWTNAATAGIIDRFDAEARGLAVLHKPGCQR